MAIDGITHVVPSVALAPFRAGAVAVAVAGCGGGGWSRIIAPAGYAKRVSRARSSARWFLARNPATVPTYLPTWSTDVKATHAWHPMKEAEPRTPIIHLGAAAPLSSEDFARVLTGYRGQPMRTTPPMRYERLATDGSSSVYMLDNESGMVYILD